MNHINPTTFIINNLICLGISCGTYILQSKVKCVNNTRGPKDGWKEGFNYHPRCLANRGIICDYLYHLLRSNLLNHLFHYVGNEIFIFYLTLPINSLQENWRTIGYCYEVD